ncbi:phosphoribosylamine--glycine ligase [Acuticoccus sp. MNP-M23]|uniref:phosphoribosylamine--glycine ligase n=1 Tax=Acuticoccus sp. MNP-M23 TaxID=3072793 RepID=UPI002815F784|nr:phosphoribosylamine--glycine ligase [Acuticoccus sp. MNP-M23]WMS44732.1 phosphoribosylamine--glycine ligase [Acuticoccus sp. MNP-M23]
MSPTGNAAVLIVGSGGREHALCAALARSPKVARVVFAGGENAGMAAIAERMEPDAVLARASEFDLVVVGPEAPLVDGLADELRALGVPVFGPGKAGAALEASKAFTKAIAAEANIPTAAARVADTRDDAHAALAAMGAPVVVKADGLAAGKGVVMATTMAEAEAAVDACFEGAFGAAGARVVIEEMMTGPEVSLFALSDGTTVRPFTTARDFKRAYDGDLGPNTGGMGAVSPAPGVPDAVIDEAMARIVKPTVDALAARGIPYVGILYAGLMLTSEGPKLIEFNVRFGDPECQAMLPRLTSDFYALLLATATGTLADAPIEFSRESAVAVVVAAAGYPGPLEKGEVIGGLDAVAAGGAEVYHAGTRDADGKVLSNGGRVLAAVALGADPEAARARVYGALETLDWPGGRMRTDIAAA